MSAALASATPSLALERRDFLIGAGSAVALSLVPGSLRAAPATTAPAVARGVVFHDTDGTGRRTAATPGIPGVLVSNGRDLVRSDAAGRYELPLGERGEVFVIKPRGWSVPVNAVQLPQFYYLHCPAGSPPMGGPADAAHTHPGIAPSGPLPASIDFPLRPQPEDDSFRIVLFGDTQPANEAQIDWMARDTIAELVGAREVAFGITVGDIVDVGRLQFMPRVNELQAMVGVPWLNIPGNHDLNFLAPDHTLATETYKSLYGPTHYAWEYGPVHFVLLHNVFWKGFAGYGPSPDVEAGGEKVIDRKNYEMDLDEAGWAFLRNYVQTVPKDRLLVVVMHINLARGAKPAPGQDGWTTKAQGPFVKKFLEIISGHPRTLSVSGHTHRQAHYFLGEDFGYTAGGKHHHFNSVCVRGCGYRGGLDEDGIPFCVSTCGTPNGYSFITFDRDRYAIEYRASRKPADYQMNIYLPSRVAMPMAEETDVFVNVFAGSERSTVELRVGGGAWTPMRLTYAVDPGIAAMVSAQDGSAPWAGLRYVRGTDRPSEHLWRAKLPRPRRTGMQLLEVRTRDQFGQTYRAERPFLVADHVQPLPDYPELRLNYRPPNEAVKGAAGEV